MRSEERSEVEWSEEHMSISVHLLLIFLPFLVAVGITTLTLPCLVNVSTTSYLLLFTTNTTIIAPIMCVLVNLDESDSSHLYLLSLFYVAFLIINDLYIFIKSSIHQFFFFFHMIRRDPGCQ